MSVTYALNRLQVLACVLFAQQLVLATIQPRPGGDAANRWSGSSSSSSSSSRQSNGKHWQKMGPTQGFTGGSALDNNVVSWCNKPYLPGCQSCPDGLRCTACWVDYPNATGSSFVLNHFNGQCDCPAGYGLLPTLPPPTWSGRHLLHQLPAVPLDDLSYVAAELDRSVNVTHLVLETSAANATNLAVTQAVTRYQDPGHLLDLGNVPGLLLPDHLPYWASSCLPCPVNYFSAGGQQGYAECKPCPGDFTTAGAAAAGNCMYPYCGPGQQPTRTGGRCRPCPIGTYSSANANNQLCYPCRKGFTTAASGSLVFADCKVPVCGPGYELDLDLLVCNACKGNSVSPGGSISQGTAQPSCMECPYGTAANGNKTVCYSGTCPFPDTFSIKCRKESLLNNTNYNICGPNGKPTVISDYCTAYPPGAELAFVDASSTSVLQREITCPAGAYGSVTKIPVITSFMDRTDCLCATGVGVSCWFVSGPEQRIIYDGGSATARFISLSNNVSIPDPQDASLKVLVRSMAGSNFTASYQALRSGYCRQQDSTISMLNLIPGLTPATNWTNPLQVNCTGPFITRVALTPQVNPNSPWRSDGFLPDAKRLMGLNQLQLLGCSGCQMDGTLPRDWGTQASLMELRSLDLGGNNFTGTLPETWGYMVNLASLILSSASTANMGRIPSSWGYMRSLTFVNLTGTNLDASSDSCAPWQWNTVNRLIYNETFLPPANYPSMPFCQGP